MKYTPQTISIEPIESYFKMIDNIYNSYLDYPKLNPFLETNKPYVIQKLLDNLPEEILINDAKSYSDYINSTILTTQTIYASTEIELQVKSSKILEYLYDFIIFIINFEYINVNKQTPELYWSKLLKIIEPKYKDLLVLKLKYIEYLEKDSYINLER